jgi:hypothetical protein
MLSKPKYRILHNKRYSVRHQILFLSTAIMSDFQEPKKVFLNLFKNSHFKVNVPLWPQSYHYTILKQIHYFQKLTLTVWEIDCIGKTS